MASSDRTGRHRDPCPSTKGEAMVPPALPHPRHAGAARSRDEALVRIRRATVAMGVTATVAMVGIGGVIAAQAPTHPPASTTAAAGPATTATRPTTTSGASASASTGATSSAPTGSNVVAASSPGATTPAASTPAASTTSGQS